MNATERSRKAIDVFNERVALERQQLEAQVKAELVEHIIARFKEVSYREQPLSLMSKYGSTTWSDGSLSSGSEKPCKHFSVFGMKKVVSESIEDRRNGRYYTGEKKYYVEKPRRYYTGEMDKKHVWRLTPDVDLPLERLFEIADCLDTYHGMVFTDSHWNGWSYDID